jgi:hypothetical protein
LSNFLKCFWSTTCKLEIKGGKRIICLKLIMAMDAIIGIGTSCCTLSPSKWLSHVDSLNIAFKLTMWPSFPFTPINFCQFVSFNLSHSLIQCSTLRVLFAIHYHACKRKPLMLEPHLKCVCALYIIYEQCALINTFKHLILWIMNIEYVLWTCNGNVACEMDIEWKLPN